MSDPTRIDVPLGATDAGYEPIRVCWERVAPHLPPANPTDPHDPRTNLDTLAAIATAKWGALDEALAALGEK